MTLQELLVQSKPSQSQAELEMISARKQAQMEQTAKLLAANKAAAASILKAAMQKLSSNEASYREVGKKIWI